MYVSVSQVVSTSDNQSSAQEFWEVAKKRMLRLPNKNLHSGHAQVEQILHWITI